MKSTTTSTDMVCLNCEKPLGFGRPDRKFCGDACRHDYHNREKADDHAETKKIQAILKKNHKILKQLLGYKQGVTVSRDELIRAGYNFDYHTHTKNTTNESLEYVFCYNYGFRLREDGFFRIVKSFQD